MADTPYCPHCYQILPPENVVYYDPGDDEQYRVYKSANPGALQRCGLLPLPRILDDTLSFCACANCKGALPAELYPNRKAKLHNILVIGAQETGKTTFLHALYERMHQLSSEFRWTWLKKQRGTGSAAIYALYKQAKPGTILAFRDIRPESLNTMRLPAGAVQGIVYLLHPGQIPAIRQAVPGVPALPDENIADTVDKLKKALPNVPIAITLTGIDYLMTPKAGDWQLSAKHQMVCRNSGHLRFVSGCERETVSCEVENILTAAKQNLPGDDSVHSSTSYFGCTAVNQMLRVEDPMLWLMAQNKLIPVRN